MELAGMQGNLLLFHQNISLLLLLDYHPLYDILVEQSMNVVPWL